jgi:formate hydrogenlyase subunit 4
MMNLFNTVILTISLDDIINFFSDPVRAATTIWEYTVYAVNWFLHKIVYRFCSYWYNVPSRFYHWMPELKDWWREYFIRTMPNMIHCYNKKYKFMVFLETWLVFFFFWHLMRKNVLAISYLLAKGLSFVVPLAVIAPIDRLPIWLGVLAAFFIELIVVHIMIFFFTYGKDWKTCNRFKRIPPNRQHTIEFFQIMYTLFKGRLLLNAICYSDRRILWRDYFQHHPVRGSIWPDYDYFAALVELDTASNLRYGVLFILALSSLTVYSIILAGWSSNSKYAFIGALRSAAQMISYEVAISLILLPVVLMSGSLNLTKIVFAQATTIWFIFPLLPVGAVFLIAMLAETNRTPFDLPEAEAELVAGYNVDYSALPFAMFFLGEYCNMIMISVLFCLLFLGGWYAVLGVGFVLILTLKAAFLWVYFVLTRATLPRYRYDQLMDIGWKTFLPVSGGFMLFVSGAAVAFYVAPVVHELPALQFFVIVLPAFTEAITHLSGSFSPEVVITTAPFFRKGGKSNTPYNAAIVTVIVILALLVSVSKIYLSRDTSALGMLLLLGAKVLFCLLFLLLLALIFVEWPEEKVKFSSSAPDVIPMPPSTPATPDVIAMPPSPTPTPDATPPPSSPTSLPTFASPAVPPRVSAFLILSSIKLTDAPLFYSFCTDLSTNARYIVDYSLEAVNYLPSWLFVTPALFFLGLLGMSYNYRNFLVTMMCVEIVYLGAVTSFVCGIEAAIYGTFTPLCACCNSTACLGYLLPLLEITYALALTPPLLPTVPHSSVHYLSNTTSCCVHLLYTFHETSLFSAICGKQRWDSLKIVLVGSSALNFNAWGAL